MPGPTVIRRKPRLKADQIECIRVSYMRGVPYPDIARQACCHVSAVRRLAEKFGWIKAPNAEIAQQTRISRALSLKAEVSTDSKQWLSDMLADCQESLIGIRATSVLTVDEWHRREQAMKLVDDRARRALGLDQGSGSVKFTLQVLQTAQPKPIKAQVVDAEVVEGKSSESVEIEQKEDEKTNPS